MSEIEFSKTELLQRIHQGFAAFDALIQPLTEAELSQTDSAGWAVKDHLAHLAAWEGGVAALLQKRDRYARMRVPDINPQELGENEINDLVYRGHAQLSPSEARQLFYDSHQDMLDAIEPLSDEELQLPYAAYLPQGSQSDPQDPVWYWIVADTYSHYEEHAEIIQKILSDTGSKS